METENKTNNEDSELVSFARKELEMLFSKNEQDNENTRIQKIINDDILEIINVFSKQGHSGFSESYAIGMLKRLLEYKPILPLTGDESEWNDCGLSDDNDEKVVYQNKRCPAVFKCLNKRTGNSESTYIDKYAFSDNGGLTWFASNRVMHLLGLNNVIEFPFVVPDKPENIYIKYLNDVKPGETSDDFIDITGNWEEINALRIKYESEMQKT